MITHRWLLAVLLLLSGLVPAEAATRWDASVSDFARQIATVTGKETVRFLVVNRSSLSGREVADIRKALEEELRASGVVAGASATASVRVTLSQNNRGGLWVAEIDRGNESHVVMTAVELSLEVQQTERQVRLNKTLLHVQLAPILDVALISLQAESRLLVLDPESLVSYRSRDGAWKKDQVLPIEHSQPFPRDIRGRIVSAADPLFRLYLPGLLCNGGEQQGQFSLQCGASDDPWPIGQKTAYYNRSRNFFTGALVPVSKMDIEPFYSVADFPAQQGIRSVFRLVSGKAVVSDGQSLQVLEGTQRWGSDLTTIVSGCGSSGEVIATESATETLDGLRAYEISAREVIPVSAVLPLDGEVTALWPGDNASVIAVVHNQQVNQYEAYRVSVSCN